MKCLKEQVYIYARTHSGCVITWNRIFQNLLFTPIHLRFEENNHGYKCNTRYKTNNDKHEGPVILQDSTWSHYGNSNIATTGMKNVAFSFEISLDVKGVGLQCTFYRGQSYCSNTSILFYRAQKRFWCFIWLNTKMTHRKQFKCIILKRYWECKYLVFDYMQIKCYLF